MEIKFKIGSLDDVKGIIELCNECFEESTDLNDALTCFKKTMHDENQIYLVGILDDKIIAHTKITIIPTIFKEMNTYAILNHVCVKPEYRRHNIATKMLDEIVKILKERNCTSMKLWSRNFRVAAHACYTNYGFTIDDAKFFAKMIGEENEN